jgi:hypothetical protein
MAALASAYVGCGRAFNSYFKTSSIIFRQGLWIRVELQRARRGETRRGEDRNGEDESVGSGDRTGD